MRADNDCRLREVSNGDRGFFQPGLLYQLAGFGMNRSVDVDADEDPLPLEFDVFNRQHPWHGGSIRADAPLIICVAKEDASRPERPTFVLLRLTCWKSRLS